MSTASQLRHEGAQKIRLPQWNEHAYLDVSQPGRFVYLYDVLAGVGGGQPVPMLVADCDLHDNWQAIERGPKVSDL